MPLNRRQFLSLAVTGAAAMGYESMSPVYGTGKSKIKAILFDAFPVFDSRPVFILAEHLFPGRGAELSNVWRTKQFEYQWLHALSGRYVDFWQATEDSLVYAARLLKLELTPHKRKYLMDAYLSLKAWPDAPAALETLRSEGLRLAILSNATPKILDAGIKNSSLEGKFEHVISTDKIKTYKPDPRAYQMAIEAFGLTKEEFLFAAFAGWDAAGAKSFGYTTYWVNRLNLPQEQLGVTPDAAGKDLSDLVAFVKALRQV